MRNGVCVISVFRGTTLLEMMIALAAALLLMALAVKGYVAVYRAQHQLHAAAVQYFNAERLMFLFNDEIAAAGNIGCARLVSGVAVVPFKNHTLTIENALEVNANILGVRYQAMNTVELLENMRDTFSMRAETGSRFRRGQLLLISDCSHAEIFEVGRALITSGGQLIRATSPLHYKFQRHAEIGAYVERRYFLRAHGSSQFQVLVRSESDRSTIELITGINQLKLNRSGNGVRYSFATGDENSQHAWSQYAAVMARLAK